MATIGVNDYIGKKFKEMSFEGEWLNSFGRPEKNFRMLIKGAPKNGKTEFCIKLAKYLAGFTKVYYNSAEQKISKSLQDALKRNAMQEVNGKVIFGDGESVEQMKKRLKKRNSPGVCFIDSLDYLNLTTEQYKDLIEALPHKIFIIICWSVGKQPKAQAAKDIEYMVDIIAHVKDFKAEMGSRFGGNVPFVIWDKVTRKNGTLQLTKKAQSELFEATLDAEIPTINA